MRRFWAMVSGFAMLITLVVAFQINGSTSSIQFVLAIVAIAIVAVAAAILALAFRDRP